MSRLEEYLNLKSEIIKPALLELRDELLEMGYLVKVVEGGIDRDLLPTDQGELDRVQRERTPLLGQISFRTKNYFNHKETVVIGYIGGQVEFINPITNDKVMLDLNSVEKSLIQRLVKEKLNV